MNDGEQDDSPLLRRELVVPWSEVLLVVFAFTGYFILAALFSGIAHATGEYQSRVRTDAYQFRLISHQAIMLAAMFAFLRHRGWLLADLHIRRDWRGTLIGVLFSFVMVFIYEIYSRQVHLHGLVPHHAPFAVYVRSQLTFWVTVLHEFVNAYYEEVTMMAYAFNQFAAKVGPGASIGLVVLLRVAFHLYKDPIYLPFTAIHFALSAVIYLWTRNLWPLVLSHALYDIIVLTPDVGT